MKQLHYKNIFDKLGPQSQVFRRVQNKLIEARLFLRGRDGVEGEGRQSQIWGYNHNIKECPSKTDI